MAGMADGGVPGRDLAWLLDDLADRVKDFRRAVILSRDGLLIAASPAPATGSRPGECGRRSSSSSTGSCS
jgi:hypothetical protein